MTLSAKDPSLAYGYDVIPASGIDDSLFFDMSIISSLEQQLQQFIRHNCARDIVNEFYQSTEYTPNRIYGSSYYDIIALYGPIDPRPGYRLLFKYRANSKSGYTNKIHTFVHERMWEKGDYLVTWKEKNTDTDYWNEQSISDAGMQWYSFYLYQPSFKYYISLWMETTEGADYYVEIDNIYVGEESLT
jgi:hypothetical protein